MLLSVLIGEIAFVCASVFFIVCAIWTDGKKDNAFFVGGMFFSLIYLILFILLFWIGKVIWTSLSL